MRADPLSCHARLDRASSVVAFLFPPSVILDSFTSGIQGRCFSLSSSTALRRGSRVFVFPFVREEKDTGFPLKTCGNDRERQNSAGFRPPHDEVPSTSLTLRSGQALLFRQKDPKPLAPGRGPKGAFTPVPVAWAAELATLKQSSPPHRIVRDLGRSHARRRQDKGKGNDTGFYSRLDPRLKTSGTGLRE